MSELPKMCPDCGHRCLAPTVVLGDAGCDHCKALECERVKVFGGIRKELEKVRKYYEDSAQDYLRKGDEINARQRSVNAWGISLALDRLEAFQAKKVEVSN